MNPAVIALVGGLVLGTVFGLGLGGTLALNGRADAVRRAYLAGMRAAQSERYTVPPVSWEDLEGDEDFDWSRP